MKLLIKTLTCFAILFSFAITTQAQCVPTQGLQGQTTTCEGSIKVYYVAYATHNGASINFNVNGGTILRTISRYLNPKEALKAIVVKWDSAPGSSVPSASIEFNKSAAGCSHTETVNVTLLDAATGGCN